MNLQDNVFVLHQIKLDSRPGLPPESGLGPGRRCLSFRRKYQITLTKSEFRPDFNKQKGVAGHLICLNAGLRQKKEGKSGQRDENGRGAEAARVTEIFGPVALFVNLFTQIRAGTVKFSGPWPAAGPTEPGGRLSAGFYIFLLFFGWNPALSGAKIYLRSGMFSDLASSIIKDREHSLEFMASFGPVSGRAPVGPLIL